MSDWYAADRVTICSEGEHFSVYAIDIDEHMDHKAEGSMLVRVMNSGRVKTYIPTSYTPDFDAQGKDIIITTECGETFSGEIYKEVKQYKKDGVEVHRYKHE